MVSISSDAQFVVPASVMTRELGDEAVLLNLETGTYFGLNEVGLRVWQLLTKGCNVQQATAELEAEFDVPPAVLQQDVTRLVSELVENGLVQVAPV